MRKERTTIAEELLACLCQQVELARKKLERSISLGEAEASETRQNYMIELLLAEEKLLRFELEQCDSPLYGS